MKAIQALAIVVVSYLACLFVSFVAIIVTAGATSSWGASRAGTAMMTMLAGSALLFVAGGFVDFFLLRSCVPPVWGRVAIVLGYACFAVATLVGIAFMSAVIFNR